MFVRRGGDKHLVASSIVNPLKAKQQHVQVLVFGGEFSRRDLFLFVPHTHSTLFCRFPDAPEGLRVSIVGRGGEGEQLVAIRLCILSGGVFRHLRYV